MREALSYSYTLLDLTTNPTEIIQIALDEGLIKVEEASEFEVWLLDECHARTHWEPTIITEKLNPHLRQVLEGEEPSYAYTDRLRGMVKTLAVVLANNPSSRRAYWPMFQPEDAIRAVRQTRIPCTLGYWVCIRTVGDKDYLHLEYLERSCDFGRFWLFDIFFARYLQSQILGVLKTEFGLEGISMGYTSHHILSFHRTEDEAEEIY